MGELQQEMALLLWLMCVNGAPIILKKLVGDRFQQPLDWNQLFFDGRPILGSSKTYRGVASALLVSVLIGNIYAAPLSTSLLFGALSMAGDITSSFIKRRIGMAPSAMALGLDQIPESLFPLLGCRELLGISYWQIFWIVLAFLFWELLLSRILFLLKIRKTPY